MALRRPPASLPRGSAGLRRRSRTPGHGVLAVERCEPRSLLAADCVSDPCGAPVGETASVDQAGSIDLSGAAFDTLVNRSFGGIIDLSGARFGTFVNVVPGALIRVDGARFGTLFNAAAGVRVTVADAGFEAIVNVGSGVSIDIGMGHTVEAAWQGGRPAADLSGVDVKTLTKKITGGEIDLSGVDVKTLTKKITGGEIDLAGVDVKTLTKKITGGEIDLSGVDVKTLTKKITGGEIDLAGARFGTLVNAGSGVEIGIAGVPFDDLVNLGPATLVRLRDATFSTLVNRGGQGTRIDVQGGRFSTLDNRADGVASVRVSGAAFATVSNAGSGVGLLDVSGVSGPATVLNDGDDVTIRFVGGDGDDVFVNDATGDGLHGGDVRLDVDLGGGDDRMVIGGRNLSGRLAGGGGRDAWMFMGAVGGGLLVEDVGRDDADTLDFSLLTGGGITVDLGKTSPQEVRPGFVVTLGSGEAIENVIGTPGDDTILGNGRGGTLLGADPADDRAGSVEHGPGRTQVVYLDFDSRTDPGERAYGADEREAIVAGLERLFVGFGVTFTTIPAAGDHATVHFNESRPDGTPGGRASAIDFGNRDPGGTATVQLHGLLGLPGGPASTAANVVAASVWMAAHETGHLLGLRHADSYGPVGFGVHAAAAEAGLESVPAHPGPRAAWGTNRHVIATPALTGFALDDLVGDHFFGAREAVKLAFARYASPVPDGRLTVVERAGGGEAADAQAISLHHLPVPRSARGGFESGKEAVVAAVAVSGGIGASGERDVYRIEGRAGDLVNLQVMSLGLSRLAAQAFDSVLTVCDSAGTVVATSDDDGECADPNIVDLRLPADGAYFLEIRAFDGRTTGAYELFVWRFDTASPTTGTDTIHDAVPARGSLAGGVTDMSAVAASAAWWSSVAAPRPDGGAEAARPTPGGPFRAGHAAAIAATPFAGSPADSLPDTGAGRGGVSARPAASQRDRTRSGTPATAGARAAVDVTGGTMPSRGSSGGGEAG